MCLIEKAEDTMKKYFENITDEKRWLSETEKLLKENNFSEQFIIDFHITWTVSGHHIREQINDDKKLIKLLRHILPRYSGEGIMLFRGENQERWRKKQIGFCWTTSKETAQMFGRGLNSIYSGGLLIACDCEAEWIITGPSDHSNYLGESEYTVNPSLLKGIKVLFEYSSVDA